MSENIPSVIVAEPHSPNAALGDSDLMSLSSHFTESTSKSKEKKSKKKFSSSQSVTSMRSAVRKQHKKDKKRSSSLGRVANRAGDDDESIVSSRRHHKHHKKKKSSRNLMLDDASIESESPKKSKKKSSDDAASVVSRSSHVSKSLKPKKSKSKKSLFDDDDENDDASIGSGSLRDKKRSSSLGRTARGDDSESIVSKRHHKHHKKKKSSRNLMDDASVVSTRDDGSVVSSRRHHKHHKKKKSSRNLMADDASVESEKSRVSKHVKKSKKSDDDNASVLSGKSHSKHRRKHSRKEADDHEVDDDGTIMVIKDLDDESRAGSRAGGRGRHRTPSPQNHKETGLVVVKRTPSRGGREKLTVTRSNPKEVKDMRNSIDGTTGGNEEGRHHRSDDDLAFMGDLYARKHAAPEEEDNTAHTADNTTLTSKQQFTGPEETPDNPYGYGPQETDDDNNKKSDEPSMFTSGESFKAQVEQRRLSRDDISLASRSRRGGRGGSSDDGSAGTGEGRPSVKRRSSISLYGMGDNNDTKTDTPEFDGENNPFVKKEEIEVKPEIEGNPFVDEPLEKYVAPKIEKDTHNIKDEVEAAVAESGLELTMAERLQAGEEISTEEALMLTVAKMKDKIEMYEDERETFEMKIKELEELVEEKEAKIKALEYGFKKMQEGGEDKDPSSMPVYLAGIFFGSTPASEEEKPKPKSKDNSFFNQAIVQPDQLDMQDSSSRVGDDFDPDVDAPPPRSTMSFQKAGAKVRRAKADAAAAAGDEFY